LLIYIPVRVTDISGLVYYGQASKEFTDLRLRSHILTVLKCLPTASPKSPTNANVFQFPSGLSE
jgi:hypothetical protein